MGQADIDPATHSLVIIESRHRETLVAEVARFLD